MSNAIILGTRPEIIKMSPVIREFEEKNTLEYLGIESGKYFLVTAHRQENVDDPVKFAGILKGLEELGKEFDTPVIYPIHPRSKIRMQEFGMKIYGNIRFIDPVDYLDFLNLEKEARLVLTDSGGYRKKPASWVCPA